MMVHTLFQWMNEYMYIYLLSNTTQLPGMTNQQEIILRYYIFVG